MKTIHFSIIARSILEKTRNTHFILNIFFFENRAVYEIMWKNVEWDRPQMIWRMRIACWIPKATNAHTGCAIPLASPLQQWLHERASMLRYTYIAWFVIYKIINNVLSTLIFNEKRKLMFEHQDIWTALKLKLFQINELVSSCHSVLL
jgi:hypothetical protein